ncbi:MAG: DoxX family protein [bacterium]|nr:DoxX family protein [bacterium]
MNLPNENTMGGALVAVARVLLVLLFAVTGFGILTNMAGTAGFYASLGIPAAMAVVVLVLIVKFVGIFTVATGIHAREGAWALIAFVVFATLIAHTAPGEMVNALKNLSIVGGLLLVAIYGAGPMSLAKHCPCPACKAKHGGGSGAGSTGAPMM